jgi:hypothetical protein
VVSGSVAIVIVQRKRRARCAGIWFISAELWSPMQRKYRARRTGRCLASTWFAFQSPSSTPSCSVEVLPLLALALPPPILAWSGLVANFPMHSTWGFLPLVCALRCLEFVGFLFTCGRSCPTFGAVYWSVLQLVVRNDPGQGSSLPVASLLCYELGFLRCSTQCMH